MTVFYIKRVLKTFAVSNVKCGPEACWPPEAGL